MASIRYMYNTVLAHDNYRLLLSALLCFDGPTDISTSPIVLTHLKLFLSSLILVMIATGSVSPVAFWITGSCEVLASLRGGGGG